jgi:chlorobactene glucosyltransferase
MLIGALSASEVIRGLRGLSALGEAFRGRHKTMAEVSVVIPARNEEANIERVVRSVAAQEDVREIIVVDDGSEDTTPGILERLMREIPRLRVVRNDGFPEGWMGKTYALATGAKLARGKWLLFTDADTFHRPGSLKELLPRAEAAGAALLSVSPGQQTPTWWEKSVIPFVFAHLSRLYRFEDVSNSASPRAAANGQYMLVRREVYEQTGGFEAIRGEILEDVEFARRVKQSGGRLVFLPGSEWIETRMYTRFSEMWDGWTKNLYLLYERSLGRALADVAEAVLIDFTPLAVGSFIGLMALLGFGGRAGLAAAALLLLAVVRMSYYGQRLIRIGFPHTLSYYGPQGAMLFALLMLNSIRAYKWGGHVNWKGRSYPVGSIAR